MKKNDVQEVGSPARNLSRQAKQRIAEAIHALAQAIGESTFEDMDDYEQNEINDAIKALRLIKNDLPG